MKSFLDFEEKNVEKAVEKACAELNVSRDKLKYDIISHGSSGIFGLVGTKKALIRVFVPDLSNKQLQAEIFDGNPAVKESLKPEDINPIQNDVSALVDEAFGIINTPPVPPAPEKKRAPAPKKNKPAPAKPEQPKQKARSVQSSPAKMKPVPEKAEPENSDLKSPGPQKVETEQPEQQLPASDESALPVDAAMKIKNTEAAAAIALSLAQKILDTMAVEAELTVDNSSDFCRINVKVSEPGVLIGKKGQTLEAIQYLIDKVVNKQCGKGNHIIFDVEGYVELRKTELTDLASRLASKAMKTGKPSTMTRMNAHDRRIVHVSLKNNPSVRTQSVGDGYYRKLIIFPKKKMPKQSSKAAQNE